MIVAVYARYADFCGNVDFHLHGYYEVDGIKQARAVFPEGGLCGWTVEYQVDLIKQLPATIQEIGPEKDYR